MRLGTLSLAAACGGLLLAGCAWFMGLHDRPLVEGESDAGADVTASRGDACAPRGARWCESLCPVPDFCDDFDDAAAPAAGWSPLPGVPQPTVVNGSIQLADDTSAGGAGRVLLAHVDCCDGGDALATISHLFDAGGSRPDGLRVRVRMRLASVALVDAEAPTEPFNGLFGVLFSVGGTTNAGVGVGLAAKTTFTPGELELALSQRKLIGKQGIGDQVLSAAKAPGARFGVTYVPYELVVAPRPILLRHGLSCEANADGGDESTVMARVDVLQSAKCAPLIDTLRTADWYAAPFVAIGAYLRTEGALDVAFDGLAIDALR